MDIKGNSDSCLIFTLLQASVQYIVFCGRDDIYALNNDYVELLLK